MAKRNLVPHAFTGLEKFKIEVAQELGVEVPHQKEQGTSGYIPAKQCGVVGGNMVKKMIEAYEKNLVE